MTRQTRQCHGLHGLVEVVEVVEEVVETDLVVDMVEEQLEDRSRGCDLPSATET